MDEIISMDFKYAYLFGTSLLLVPWIILFLLRKDLRKEMLYISLVVGAAGVIVEYLWYTKDWWNPPTITGTVVGIEDFILGFAAGGIGAVIYKEVFHKTMYRSVSLRISHWILALPLLLGFGTAHILFVFFGLFTFWANIVGVVVGLLLMSLIRKDLEKEAIEGGLLLTIITIPIYWILFFFFPSFRDHYWNYENVSGVLFLGIPYEDLVWWFFIGASISIFYDYWNLLRLRKEPRS